MQFIHDTILTPAIVEQFIDGRELYVGVMGNHRLQVFPVWEMSFAKMPENNWRIATERVKWEIPEETRHRHPLAILPRAEVQHLAKRVYRALDLSGYGRIDMRMKANGELYVIEANPNPQLAHGEDFAASAQRAGVAYTKLIERIINLGLQWQPSRMNPDAVGSSRIRARDAGTVQPGQRRRQIVARVYCSADGARWPAVSGTVVAIRAPHAGSPQCFSKSRRSMRTTVCNECNRVVADCNRCIMCAAYGDPP